MCNKHTVSSFCSCDITIVYFLVTFVASGLQPTCDGLYLIASISSALFVTEHHTDCNIICFSNFDKEDISINTKSEGKSEEQQ